MEDNKSKFTEACHSLHSQLATEARRRVKRGRVKLARTARTQSAHSQPGRRHERLRMWLLLMIASTPCSSRSSEGAADVVSALNARF